jgi:hypothetical protein
LSRNAHRNTNPVEIRRTARALAAVEVIMEPPTWANCGWTELAWSVLVAVWVMEALLVAAFPGVAILVGRVPESSRL